MQADAEERGALHANEAFFHRLFDEIPDAVLLADRSGRIVLANAHAEAVFGRSPADLHGRMIEELMPERYRSAHRGHRKSYESNPHTRPMGLGLDLFALRADGVEIPVEISLSKIETEQGALTTAVVRDVSEHRRMQEALRQQEERLQVALTNSPTAVFSQDEELRYTWAYNPPGSLSVDGFVGARDREVFGAHGAELETLKRRVLEGADTARAEVPLEIDGVERDFDVFACPRLDAQGRITGVSSAMTDISEQKEASRALERFSSELEQLVQERTVALAHANAQLQQTSAERGRLYQALLGSQERERARLSRDLHDQIGQALTGVMLMLDERVANAAGRAEAKTLVAQTIDDVRRLSRALRPSVLDEVGLEAALRQQAREVSERTGVKVEVLVHLREALPEDYEIALYRVAQEALTNVVRHARAHHASIVLTSSREAIRLTVEDDGRGFEPEARVSDHLGLAGMRERVELLGGTLRIEAAHGEGTTIHVRLPLR